MEDKIKLLLALRDAKLVELKAEREKLDDWFVKEVIKLKEN